MEANIDLLTYTFKATQFGDENFDYDTYNDFKELNNLKNGFNTFINQINERNQDIDDKYDEMKQIQYGNASLLGLDNVDNTSDEDKPVSTSQQEEFDKKADINGSELETFKVKAAENGDDAVNKSQLDEAGFPIGHHYLQIRETPYDNELVEYGGEYIRADYPKLWEFIENQPSLLLNDTDWQVENTANGMCGYFSSGDGSTTFRLRNLNEAMLIAVDGVTNTVGSFREGEIKSHTHTYSYWTSATSSNGTSGTSARGRSSKSTDSVGGDKNTVDRIGALPLIIAK